MNLDILLRRYNAIRKAWTNSRTPEEEQEWYDKLQIIEKEIKDFKANSDAVNKSRIDYGANVLSHYITDTKKAKKGKEIQNKMED